ncbi:hypothetical protein OIU77_015265 [Salix suchowensis]|uniref:Uncharacterized protein n=1 Tax=Salix suchowensis TaxID=1278906 RepID=A0ABQ8ZSA8_9ROSI|nr:hypothetical protein OIU77_015265 [Salix suchowensis]
MAPRKSTRGKAPMEQLATKNPRVAPRSINKYTVQCEKCSKWRVISTVEEYEEIRCKMEESPYVCACDDPANIEYNATRTWAIDRPGILKTPEGFTRSLEVRRDFSRIDAKYIAPTGKKLRTLNEIAVFIEENPTYKDVKLSDFSFTSPKIIEDTIPEDVN